MKPKSLHKECKEKGLNYNKEFKKRQLKGKPGMFNIYEFGKGVDWITGVRTDYSMIKY